MRGGKSGWVLGSFSSRFLCADVHQFRTEINNFSKIKRVIKMTKYFLISHRIGLIVYVADDSFWVSVT